MTWSTNDGVASTVNLTHTSGAETIFILKRLLKNEGWTVLSSSDGSTYNSSGDQITSSGSGAGGMDNSDAWFRIEDPLSVREYVFQRGTSSYIWKWIYSASDGFTGGSPDATTIPTATDEQGLARTLTTFQTMFPTSGSWRAHIAAQDAAHNGVYAWWCCTYGSAEDLFLCCEAIDSTTTSSDSDPCIHYGSDDAPVSGNLVSTSVASNGDSLRGWMRYNEADEQWSGLTACYYYSTDSFWPNPTNDSYSVDPHDTYVKTAPIHFLRHPDTATVVGYKGAGYYLRWNPDNTQYDYTDLIQDGSDYWVVFGDLLLPGWPDSTLPGT